MHVCMTSIFFSSHTIISFCYLKSIKFSFLMLIINATLQWLHLISQIKSSSTKRNGRIKSSYTPLLPKKCMSRKRFTICCSHWPLVLSKSLEYIYNLQSMGCSSAVCCQQLSFHQEGQLADGVHPISAVVFSCGRMNSKCPTSEVAKLVSSLA